MSHPKRRASASGADDAGTAAKLYYERNRVPRSRPWESLPAWRRRRLVVNAAGWWKIFAEVRKGKEERALSRVAPVSRQPPAAG